MAASPSLCPSPLPPPPLPTRAHPPPSNLAPPSSRTLPRPSLAVAWASHGAGERGRPRRPACSQLPPPRPPGHRGQLRVPPVPPAHKPPVVPRGLKPDPEQEPGFRFPLPFLAAPPTPPLPGPHTPAQLHTSSRSCLPLTSPAQTSQHFPEPSPEAPPPPAPGTPAPTTLFLLGDIWVPDEPSLQAVSPSGPGLL